MFWKVFLFEFQYRLRRPAIYMYFLLSLAFVFLAFAHGAMPLDEGQWINGTAALSFYIAIMSLLMMIVNSSIMGVALHRDIEYNTRDYYFSYPITKGGYFWGRFLASFLFVIAINASVPIGAWLGGLAGKAFGWSTAYGANHLQSYLYPFFTIGIPNLFFSASLFFGLVAVTNNIKVIYCSGIFLFLGYMIANFLLNTSANTTVMYLADPFAVNAINFEKARMSIAQKNIELIHVSGLLLWNRVIWIGVSLLALLITYARFSFKKVSSSRKFVKEDVPASLPAPAACKISYAERYHWKTFRTLVNIEVTNITRDAYFWMIVIGGGIFLAFVFSHVPSNFNVREMPRTSVLLMMFNQIFLLFVFCIIVFYAGEIIHREKDTGYAIINDSLPPSTFVLHFSKFTSLCLLTLFLVMTPMLIGIGVQAAMRFPFFNIRLYLTTLLGVTFLKGLAMAMLAYFLHVLINRKFVALGVAIVFSVLTTLAEQSGYLTYHPFLYSSAPFFAPSDLDGIGHMLKPVTIFNIYWLLFGGILTVMAYLFFPRGFFSGAKDRLQLAWERFDRQTLIVSSVLLVLFCTTGAFVFYNVNVKNKFYTRDEWKLHAAMLEKRLHHWKYLPQPAVRKIELEADLFPSNQSAKFSAMVTIANENHDPIDSILLDGDNLSGYQISAAGKILSFSCPVFFQRGKYNLTSPAEDSSSYRIYRLPKPLLQGDSVQLEVKSYVAHEYFENNLFGADLLRNGTFTGIGLPGLGYDEDEELKGKSTRADFGLGEREERFPLSREAAGRNKLLNGATGLTKFVITASTEADQTVILPGNRIATWSKDGRIYFKSGFDAPGIYGSLVLISARYREKADSVQLANGKWVNLRIYYDPSGSMNLDRFMFAAKEGMNNYSNAFGAYPFSSLSLVETSIYAPRIFSTAGVESFNERLEWSSKFDNDPTSDVSYYLIHHQLASQWWGNQLMPSHTRGSEVISQALPNFSALAMTEQKFGREKCMTVIEPIYMEFKWSRGNSPYNQRPLLKATNWYDYNQRACLVLMGWQDLVGKDNMKLALKDFQDSFAFKNAPPYADCGDLYSALKKYTPDSLCYFLKDNFENVCFYENRIKSAAYTKAGSRFRVSMDLELSKTYQDSLGRKISTVPMNDWVDVGVYGEGDAKPLSIKKYRLKDGPQKLEIEVDGKPVEVKLDPYMRLMDLNLQDNNFKF